MSSDGNKPEEQGGERSTAKLEPEQPEPDESDLTQPAPNEHVNKDATERPAQQPTLTPHKTVEATTEHGDEIETPGPLGEAEKFWKFWKKNPRKAAWAAIFLVACAFLGWALAPWEGELRERFCDHVTSFLCPQPPAIKSASVDVSTKVPKCLTGYLSYKLRNTKQNARWGAGTKGLLICGNGRVEAPPSELLSAFAKIFPRCLLPIRNGNETTISLNFESGAICRAAYSVQDGQVVPSTLESGVNLCLNEKEVNILPDAKQFITSEYNGDQKVLFSCNKLDIVVFGF